MASMSALEEAARALARESHFGEDDDCPECGHHARVAVAAFLEALASNPPPEFRDVNRIDTLRDLVQYQKRSSETA